MAATYALKQMPWVFFRLRRLALSTRGARRAFIELESIFLYACPRGSCLFPRHSQATYLSHPWTFKFESGGVKERFAVQKRPVRRLVGGSKGRLRADTWQASSRRCPAQISYTSRKARRSEAYSKWNIGSTRLLWPGLLPPRGGGGGAHRAAAQDRVDDGDASVALPRPLPRRRARVPARPAPPAGGGRTWGRAAPREWMRGLFSFAPCGHSWLINRHICANACTVDDVIENVCAAAK